MRTGFRLAAELSLIQGVFCYFCTLQTTHCPLSEKAVKNCEINRLLLWINAADRFCKIVFYLAAVDYNHIFLLINDFFPDRLSLLRGKTAGFAAGLSEKFKRI